MLPWRSILGYLDGALVQPHGPYVAIGFADPAYPGPQQAEDVFLLDRRSGSLVHVPGFPASIRLKLSSMAWAADGRLVLLVRDEDGHGSASTVPAIARWPSVALSFPR